MRHIGVPSWSIGRYHPVGSTEVAVKIDPTGAIHGDESLEYLLLELPGGLKRHGG